MFPLSLHPEGARLPNLILPVLNEMFILHQVLISLNITPLRFARIAQSSEGPELSQREPWPGWCPSLCPCSLVLGGTQIPLCSTYGWRILLMLCWPCSHWRWLWHYLLSPCLIPTFSPFCPHFRFPQDCSYTLEPSRLSVQERSRHWIQDICAQCCNLNGPIFYSNGDQCLSLEQRDEMER